MGSGKPGILLSSKSNCMLCSFYFCSLHYFWHFNLLRTNLSAAMLWYQPFVKNYKPIFPPCGEENASYQAVGLTRSALKDERRVTFPWRGLDYRSFFCFSTFSPPQKNQALNTRTSSMEELVKKWFTAGENADNNKIYKILVESNLKMQYNRLGELESKVLTVNYHYLALLFFSVPLRACCCVSVLWNTAHLLFYSLELHKFCWRGAPLGSLGATVVCQLRYQGLKWIHQPFGRMVLTTSAACDNHQFY